MTVDVSDVSFTSSTPVTVTVCAVLQQFAPGQTLSKVILAVLKETEPAILEARFTVKEGDGSWVKRTVNAVVPLLILGLFRQ